MRKPIVAAASLALALACAGAGRAQSLLERSPNLSGGWVGNSGQLYFNFMHRFSIGDEPARKVSNVPTFTVAAGLPAHTLAGFHYATNSDLAPGYPNEWEFWVRNQPLAQERGAPLDLAAQVGYNLAAEGVDAEVSVARRFGALRLVGAGRALSSPHQGVQSPQWALAGGGTLRISRFVALAGDVATLLEREPGEKVAWSAGLHLAIPNTPHTLSLQAANTNAYTLQGTSRGLDETRYGFEFTIPLTLSRWLRTRAPVGPAAVPPAPREDRPTPAVEGSVARAGMRNMAFVSGRLEVAAGTTVEWTNHDPLAHTVTSVDGQFDSGLIQPGGVWRRTFTAPGTYAYACTPHPFMKGVVIVR